MKDIKAIVNSGAIVRKFTSPSGVSTDVLFNGPINADGGRLKGVEVSYQQTYGFLPGFLSGLGLIFIPGCRLGCRCAFLGHRRRVE